MGSFCHDCNCINCFNTLEHEDERNKAIKMVLDRNPQAFQSKIGKFSKRKYLVRVFKNIFNLKNYFSGADSSTKTDIKRRTNVCYCNCRCKHRRDR